MDDRESIGTSPSHEAADTRTPSGGAPDGTGSIFAGNEGLLSGTGSIPLAASAGTLPEVDEEPPAAEQPSARPAHAARYVRQRTPHRSQGTVDDLTDDEPSQGYTHDSNIAIGGSTPLSGMAYRRSRNNMSRVRSGSRYGQYLEIPKGRRSIFASRERARRRRSVLALLGVVTLLVLAAMFIWNMMQNVLG